MRHSIKILSILLSCVFVVSVCDAEDECRDASGNSVQCSDATTGGSASLPKDAQAEVDELKVKMRYFKAIGFHDKSGEARDKIVAIYEEYGVPLPDEYRDE